MGFVEQLKLEYVWLDGTRKRDHQPSLRSKTKIWDKVLDLDAAPKSDLQQLVTELPMWGFDGSSTGQAEGSDSDCILKPVYVSRDPFNKSDGLIVLCEVFDPHGKPHWSNTRDEAAKILAACKDQEPWCGIEQEWTLMDRATGRPAAFAAWGEDIPEQGPYYCSVGEGNTYGRSFAEKHLKYCTHGFADLDVVGINAEVMPGQWEFQVGGPGVDPVAMSDQLWIARYILQRLTEGTNCIASFEPKPWPGDWNGAGCHTNFSTWSMRNAGGLDSIQSACEMLGRPESVQTMVSVLGPGFEKRLTGEHETCSYEEFKYGVADRTASIRIPRHVSKNRRGYFEDRRPNANCDPYRVVAALMGIVCLED